MLMCKAYCFHETGLYVEDFGMPLVLSLLILCFGALNVKLEYVCEKATAFHWEKVDWFRAV